MDNIAHTEQKWFTSEKPKEKEVISEKTSTKKSIDLESSKTQLKIIEEDLMNRYYETPDKELGDILTDLHTLITKL